MDRAIILEPVAMEVPGTDGRFGDGPIGALERNQKLAVSRSPLSHRLCPCFSRCSPGGKLQGLIGIVIALPRVAAYPIIERHWLRGYLQARVLTDHKALARAAETGSEVAIDAVLLGERHASEATTSPRGTAPGAIKK